MHHLFPWIPGWVDLNVVVPVVATVVVILVGIIVICVAFARRSRGPEQTRLRGEICNGLIIIHFHSLCSLCLRLIMGIIIELIVLKNVSQKLFKIKT